MYVRDAKNREEAWLLDRIEELELDDTAFRSRDYVVAIDERSNEKAGFGRIRIHRTDEGEVCELTSVGVLPAWRGQGVGAHVLERLVEYASDDGFEQLYSLTSAHDYLAQFGFRRIESSSLPPVLEERLAAKRAGVDPEAVPTRLAVDSFELPDRLRTAFKSAGRSESTSEDDGTSPEEFGIDPETATYKYDTGR